MRTRTKIVCTIGPAVCSYEKILELIDAGMNVARLNFSHGTHEEHLRTIHFLQKARAEKGVPLAIMLDTHGPKIRVGKLPNDAIRLKPGDRLTLVEKESLKQNEVPIHPIEIIEALSVGMRLLFDDGYITTEVIEKGERRAVLEVKNPGELKSGKGVNIPGAHIPLPALTDSDIDDIKFGCEHDIDYIAASFIRSAHHILTIKQLLSQEGKPEIQVIAKIESTQGVDNFDSIVQVADGIMVARGDLGVEVDLALVPKLQKMMIRKCYQACKPVVTATQMLESMIHNPRPTRAEVSDVANAIYDGTSLVMLSGETAVGKYPIETVQRMQSIVREAEADFDYHGFFALNSQRDYHDVSSAVSMAAVKTAYSANAKCIFAFTTSGQTARRVSRLRPPMPIIAVTPSKKHYHQLAFNWGIHPVLAEGCQNAKEAFSAASQYALSQGLLSFGDVVVVTAGVPFGKKGTTNMMIVENVGEVLVRGHKGFGSKISGKVAFVLAPEAYSAEELEGKLVVIPHCDNTFLPILKKASGVILQNFIGDMASEKYAALVAKTFEISVMSRADGAMSILKEGDEVTLDPQKGLIYRGSEECPACPVLMI
ncbi:MAG: pyruvate kinase [Verrucomicrobia bacterium]|nr:pyruvate kinase [Verrucomicrobiota bacterium]MDE3046980.1 pyruvate kinase [Verrucomicrobiota bacterium]